MFGSLLAGAAAAYIGNKISAHQGRKNANYLEDLSVASAKDLALNQPSWKRQGYETAGYNPILAINDGSFAQPVSTSMPMGQAIDYDKAEANPMSVVGGAVGLAAALTNLQKERSNLSAIRAENQARIQKAEYETNVFSARNSAFYDGGIRLDGDGKSVGVANMEHISNIRKGELDRESLLGEKYWRETLKLILDSGQDISGILGDLFKGGKSSAVQGMMKGLKK